MSPLQGFNPIFKQSSLTLSGFFWTQVPLLSLTLARNELQSLHISPNSKSMEFIRYQEENLRNFKEIFLMVYVCHKGFLLSHMVPDKCALILQTS